MEEQVNKPPAPQAKEHEANHAPPVEHKSSGLKSKWPFLIIALLFALIIPLAGYVVMNQSQNQTSSPTPTVSYQTQTETTPTTSPTPTEDQVTANWKLYINKEREFSIKYPQDEYIRLGCPNEDLILQKRTPQNQDQDEKELETCGRDGRFTIEVQSYIGGVEEPKTDNYVNVIKEDLTISGVLARKYISTKKPGAEGPIPEYSEDIYFDYGGKKFLIHFDKGVSEDVKDGLIATFKFL